MKFYLVFENSGDSIPFVSEKADLLEYYISFVNDHNVNKFSPKNDLAIKLETALQNIKDVISQYNTTKASEFTGKFLIRNKVEDYLNQEYLNYIHCQWANSNHIEYTFNELKKLNIENRYTWLLDQLPDDDRVIFASEIVYKYNVQELYFNVNYAVHTIENFFHCIKYQGDFDENWEWKEIKNIFPKNYTSNSTANLSICYNHYGRSLYNKFLNQSGTVFHDDENTYNQLNGFLNLSLHPSQTIQYSKEYLHWCNQINKEPGGNNLNIGNIPNLPDHLTEYRKIIYRNTLAQNKFTLLI